MTRPPRPDTIRAAALGALVAAGRPVTGRELAISAGLRYRQAVDALHALWAAGLAERDGRKATARWHSRAVVDHDARRRESDRQLAAAMAAMIAAGRRHEDA